MEFGRFNYLFVTFPLIIALCVMYYMHTETMKAVDRLAQKISAASPESERETRARDLQEDDDGDEFLVVSGKQPKTFQESILDSMAPMFMSTVIPNVEVVDVDKGVRRRGRRSKITEVTPAASGQAPSASEQGPSASAQ